MIYVNYEEHLLHSEQEDGSYGAWSEDYEFLIFDVSKNKNKYAEPFNIDVEVGDTVYVLYVIYSTGDSFGHADGRGEIMWVFKNKDAAHQAKTAFLDKENECTIDFKDDEGVKRQLSNPAAGYFEHLSSVNVSEMIVK